MKKLGVMVCLGLGAAWTISCAQEESPPSAAPAKPPPDASAPGSAPGTVAATTPLGTGPWTNRLAKESSPYLLQHAHNPVDWYPWGPEAFERARRENKPIFLSVGYSTCHWCHVMEHESFEDPTVAAVMNGHFVCVKVDREERPDVDKVYMTFVQASTGGGGWPMSVWLTPDLKPLYGATYFPPSNFTNVLLRISQAWEEQREEMLASGGRILDQLRMMTEVKTDSTVVLGEAILQKAYEQIKESYEPRHGGFGGAPKFPRPVALNFMLRHHARTGDQAALDMTLFTLRQMAGGGMHDHLGGGFHRYSVDERWHVPHFEKMLYDQAQLVWSYLEAHQITRDAFFADVARDILRYVSRDLTGEFGQFYSAEDADSLSPENPTEKVEGAFYVWEAGQIEAVVGADAARVFGYFHGVQPEGNVRNDPRNEFPRKNVLIVSHTMAEAAKEFGRTEAEIARILAEARVKLFQSRAGRPRPPLDDKTLTAWNGLMISAYARAHQVLGDREYLEAAEKAAAFVRAKLYDPRSGNLLRRHRKGESGIDAYLDDHAFFIQGLLDLYEASFDSSHLKWAAELQKRQEVLFGDPEGGGYFSTTGRDPSVLLRVKNDYDGAEPSPNSVAALNLLRLGQMTGEKEFTQRGGKVLTAFGSRLEEAPVTMPQLLVALGFSLGKPRQVVVAGKRGADDTLALLARVNRRFIPGRVLLLADGAEGQAFLGTRLEFIREMKMLDGRATAYVCEDQVCKLPTSDPNQLDRILDGK